NAGKHTARTGSSAYFGPDSTLNRSARVWGNPTNARADLVALLLALEAAPKTKTLRVSTWSEYAIRSINYHAFHNTVCGWTCTIGDVMKSILQGIRARSAPVHLVHIKKDEIHAHFIAAKGLA
ncbi:hypothetical protein DFH08DRAFT_644084, partial [Mycena albidolilacea]